jgi:hypothetical protein
MVEDDIEVEVDFGDDQDSEALRLRLPRELLRRMDDARNMAPGSVTREAFMEYAVKWALENLEETNSLAAMCLDDSDLEARLR